MRRLMTADVRVCLRCVERCWFSTRYSHMNIDQILTDIVSILMLPIFVVMVFCAMAGAKPEPIIKGFLDLLCAAVALPFKMLRAILAFWYEERRRTPRPRPSTKQEHNKWG